MSEHVWNHSHVYMNNTGPFKHSIERVEHIEKLYSYRTEGVHITLYSGKMFNRVTGLWYVLAGVLVVPAIVPPPENLDAIIWAGAWR